jgi:uncharacterized protein (TIGR02270 family)
MLVNQTVLSRHSEDAAFLWAQRAVVLSSHAYTWPERIRFDNRIAGHLDGLCIAGEPGLAWCLEQLDELREGGEAFAAVAVALSAGAQRALDRALVTIAELGDDVWRAALVAATGWFSFEAVGARLGDWASSGDERLRYVGLAGLAIHRRLPADVLARHLRSADRWLRARAARAAGEVGGRTSLGALEGLLSDAEPSVRLEAALALARLGASSPALQRALIELSERLGPGGERAAAGLALQAPARATDLFERWGSAGPTRRLALTVAVAAGDPRCIPDVLSWMNEPEFARPAGFVYSMITGTDLGSENLDDVPEDAALGEDDEEDADLPPDRDAPLPWPAPAEVARHWSEGKASYREGGRYLAGQRFGEVGVALSAAGRVTLLGIVASGRCSERALAARLLAFEAPELPLLEVRAPATRSHVLPGVERWSVP